MRERAGIREYDWWLLGIAGAICTLGVVEIYSATHNIHAPGAPMYLKQLLWLGLGVVCMLAVSRIDYHRILEQAPILYLIGVIALVAVAAVGATRLGAKRWLPILGAFFQVSELVKLIIIIVLARFYSEVRTDRLTLGDLVKVGVLTGIPLILILKEPDLGTALVLLPVAVIGAFLAGIQWKHAAAIVLLGAMMLPVGWHFMNPYQKQRVNTFLRPEEDPKKAGYQGPAIEDRRRCRRIQGKGTGTRKPESRRIRAHPIFGLILAALAEEPGFIGVLLTLALYIALLLRLFHNATARDGPRRHVSGDGVAAVLGFHVLVNAAMVIGYMPVTGIPLPLMSYGGSATLFIFLALGLVMNVRIRRFVN